MSRPLIIAALVLLAVWSLLPVVLTFETSFLSTYSFSNPLRLIAEGRFHLDNWAFMPWALLARWTTNSAIVCVSSTVLCVVISALAGFGFAKFHFPGKEAIFWLFLLGMMVPVVLLFLPRFLIVKQMGMANSYLGMIAPMLVYPAGVFFSRQYMAEIPDDIIEAARMDGASELRIFVSFIIPLSLPLLAILALFSFVNVWQQFMWQFLIAQDEGIQTLVVGLGSFLRGVDSGGSFQVSKMAGVSIEGLQAASSVILAIFPMIIFIFGQKYFMRGLRITGTDQ